MTRLTGPQTSLLLGMLTIVCVAQAPLPGYTEELSTQSDQVPIPELELIKEEESGQHRLALRTTDLGSASGCLRDYGRRYSAVWGNRSADSIASSSWDRGDADNRG